MLKVSESTQKNFNLKFIDECVGGR